MSKRILHSRPRAEADWECPRRRYWLYEFDGLGLNAEIESFEQYFGTTQHDGLAAIATFWKRDGKVDIDLIASTAQRQMYEHLIKNGEGTDEQVENFASEQAALTEGLLRGFYKHVWPRLMERYPKILAIEADVSFIHNDSGLSDKNGDYEFMAKPDLVIGTDDESELVYTEYKSTGSKKEKWINSWDRSVQVHATREAIKQTLELDCTGVLVQGLYKGYECLSPETDVLMADLRWIPVGMLQVGDKLAGFDEQSKPSVGGKPSRQWATADVQHIGRDYLPSYRLTFADGKSVVSSENHLWLTTKSGYGTGTAIWTKTKDLTTEHNLIRVLDKWSENKDYDSGYLAGAFDSEGCLVHHKDKKGYCNTWLSFTQNDNVVLSEAKRILEKQRFGFLPMKHKNRSTHDVMVGTRPDVLRLLGQVRPKRLLQKFSFDKLGGMRVMRLTQPTKIEFLGSQEVVTLGTSTETLIAEGLATHNSYGKLSTPLAYAYHRWGNPPFTKTETLYEYKPGYKKYPTWQLEGGVKQWVENMPDDVLMEQFPSTPLIFPNPDETRKFFRQRAIREKEIALASAAILEPETSPALKEYLLDKHFDQHGNKCKPAWGFECAMQHLCFGQINDPLKAGMTYRKPHHKVEVDQNGE